MGSALKMRPVIEGWALFSGACTTRSGCAFVLKTSLYMEHILGSGWSG